MAKEEFEIDEKMVERIVEKMKRQYVSEGTEFHEVEGNLGELRSVIAGGKNELQVQNIEELAEVKSPLVRQLGKLYLKLRNPLRPLGRLIATLPQAKTLNFFLYSANLKYSLRQYLALTTAVTIICFLFGLVIGFLAGFLGRLNPTATALIAVFVGFFAALFACLTVLYIPKSIAQQRGNAANSELPFALRHMSAELKAGIGLYRTIQIISAADYGILSEEFARTTTEIEEGTDAKDALRNMAFRVQSIGLRNALMHVVRAMKTGGNLSDVMNEIAEDIAAEERNRIREFAEKMNFYGILFIFLGIVFPAMVLTLGGIKAAPLPLQIEIPITPAMMAIMFFAIMPLLLGMLVFYLKTIQPK
jgi:flagellar protein FlaJ